MTYSAPRKDSDSEYAQRCLREMIVPFTVVVAGNGDDKIKIQAYDGIPRIISVGRGPGERRARLNIRARIRRLVRQHGSDLM